MACAAFPMIRKRNAGRSARCAYTMATSKPVIFRADAIGHPCDLITVTPGPGLQADIAPAP